jgi:PrcB C-terminal
MLLAVLFSIQAIAGPPTLTFSTLADGQASMIEEQREVVVRTAAEWKALWAKHAPGQKLPVVDFSKSTVIGVFLGTRNTGGYRAMITEINRHGSDLVVTWQEEKPSPDLMVTQALTSPFHVVRIDKTADPVRFAKATR